MTQNAKTQKTQMSVFVQNRKKTENGNICILCHNQNQSDFRPVKHIKMTVWTSVLWQIMTRNDQRDDRKITIYLVWFISFTSVCLDQFSDCTRPRCSWNETPYWLEDSTGMKTRGDVNYERPHSRPAWPTIKTMNVDCIEYFCSKTSIQCSHRHAPNATKQANEQQRSWEI